MPTVRDLRVRQGQVLLMVGTSKGVFLFASSPKRDKWERGGPHFAGSPTYALGHDNGSGNRLFAGVENPFYGPALRWSDDLGKSWSDETKSTLKFPENAGVSLKRIWQIVPGSRKDTIYAGVEPSALFVSNDRGANWELVRGLFDHPHREKWMPGNGGQCLHTVLPHPSDPDRITVAMSTGGVYRTEDGGRTWRPRNAGVAVDFMPEKYPEFGQCVHKVVRHPGRPDTLFLQNHGGLYRSDDGGDSWRDIANGVPSDFGFCMAIHPHDPDVVYIVPLEKSLFRCTPEGKLRVYRTRNGGKSWEALSKGLPQKDANEVVLRDAMGVDRLNPAGVYFGTRTGKVYASADGGGSWSLVADSLPPVLCVRAVVVGDAAKIRVPGARGAVRRAVAKVKTKVKAVAKKKPLRKALAKVRAKVRSR
jgi:photosystem II stability/assembly factor-like uncharacterized protein